MVSRQHAHCEEESSGEIGSPETLPLFAELPNAQTLSVSSVQARPAVEPVADKHLRAARRLAKAIRRLPDRSAQQVKTGRAICRHLIALLEDDVEGAVARDVSGNPASAEERH